MAEPVRLHPDRRVALAAWAFPSESGKPWPTHETALMADGTWLCHCMPFLLNDRCAHVERAMQLWAEEQARRAVVP